MQYSTRKLSSATNQSSSGRSSRVSSVKSRPSVRIHLSVPDEQPKRPSIDASHISALPSTVVLTKNKLTTTVQQSTLSHAVDAQRAARFSHVSSSYAQFLKQRDMDKVKKIVSEFLVSTSP